ncbi:hypothetical protein AWC38_SpisGene630 [Stylophora pistillata]|uniref:HECT domain-containing protein n=1 Tax=Stylophora pistillata TaxID=50429 RepID=A0A2B4SX67_STYPI|nr:hypothetical protein AWC38_SpisGene630 [Stylophora pistillata]
MVYMGDVLSGQGLKVSREIVDKLNGSRTSAGQDSTTPSSLGLQSAMSSISSTVERARSMVNSSSTSASFTRLNKKERLRAMSPQPSKKAKPVEKTFEFVFLSFEEEDGHDGEAFLLDDHAIKLRGEEVSVQELVDKDESLMNLTKPASQTTRVSEPTEIPYNSGTSQNEDQDPVNNSSDPTDQLIHTITQQCLSDPVEILRYLQQEIVKGRVMDAVSESDENVGETNSICVDRQRILETTFTEFEAINDFSLTFEVDFMGKPARDLRGPRKEWIHLMNMAIKDRYFDKGLREHLADEYYYVGVMMGIALLQNGQLPCYIPLDTIDKLATVTSNKCISNIQRGLDVLGLAKIMRKFPILLHLLRPTTI